MRWRGTRWPAVLAGALAACSGGAGGAGGAGGGARPDGSGTQVATPSIDEVLAAHRDAWLALPGVVGTAIGLCDGERCIRILLAEERPEYRARIPARLEGYRVVIEVTGPLRPR